MMKDLIKGTFQQQKRVGMRMAIKYYLLYRSVMGAALFLFGIISAFIGNWMYALVGLLLFHYHYLMVENWWQLRIIRESLEKHDGEN